MELQRGHFYEFGPFRLDPSERRLARDGEAVPLTGKAFDVLLALVEHPGRVVSKDELMTTVWPESFVEESNLSVNVSTLRKALGENPAEPRFIETVPKLGYRFVAPVREIAAGPGPGRGAVVAVLERTRSRTLIEEEVSDGEPAPAALPARRRPLRGWGAALLLVAAVAAAASLASTRGPERRPTGAAFTPQDEARALVAKGRYFWAKRSAAGIQKAVECFRRALELDPEYAPAYSGLADVYVFDLADWPKAEGAARKAMELDPSLAAPHASLGFGRMFHHWDWAGAERELRRAVELDPGYTTGRQWLATWLMAHGRLDEAKAELAEARRIDPLALSLITDLAQVAYFELDFDRAEALCREALELDPTFVPAHQILRDVAVHRREADAYLGVALRVDELTFDDAAWRTTVRDAHSAGGLEGVLRAEVARLEASPTSLTYALARLYCHLDEKERALGWIERAYDERNFYLLYMKVEPAFHGIRRDPRFREVERKVGL